MNITTAAPPLVAVALTTIISPSPSPTTLLPSASLVPPVGSLAANESSEVQNTEYLDDISDPYKAFLTCSRYVVQRILVPMVLVVGVLGNAVTIVVLTRRQMRSSTNNYLTALAISDLLYLVFIFSLSIRHHPGMNSPHHWFYWHYFRYALWLTDASSSTSIWLTVTFTIERYIAVCHPIKGKVFCTESRAKRVIVAVFVLCFTLTASTPHEWVVREVIDPSTQRKTLSLGYSVLGSHTTYKKVFYWFTAVIFILLPLVLLAVFNSFLIHVVKQSRAQRRKMTNQRVERDNHSQSQENKITVMLIAVVLLALFCQLPVAAMLLYQSFYESEPNSIASNIELGLGNIFNLLSAINAACNFVLYCAMSDKYRRTFLCTFCSRWYRHPSPLHSWMATAYSNVEDGSPRFSRMSSMRMSRRSSHRSSGSGSPRGSPTHGRTHPAHRHPGHYLTVPSPSHNPSQPTPTTLLVPTNAAHLHATPEDAAAVTSPLLRKVPPSAQQGNNNSPADEGVTSPTAAAASLLNGSPNSQHSLASSAPQPSRLRRLALRLTSLWRRGSRGGSSASTTTHLAGQHIVITCQQPSVDEQTAL
ncbi:thyrotropin-releasing hormone receptor-like [Macrobrachium rosenbergii]|uniref:thyrotropin-releasing hormone receptor-like n=1 Tax=Macrobrachium rosenbergii TaxID=79674 RepID=UPI0034D552CA